MGNNSGHSGVLTLLLAVLLMSSCSASYRDPQLRTPGERTDDLAIGAKIKRKLFADDQLSGFRINVDVYQGVVTLKGRIATADLRNHAQALAAGVKGVRRVDLQLRYAEQ